MSNYLNQSSKYIKSKSSIAAFVLILLIVIAGTLALLPNYSFAHASGTSLSLNPTSEGYGNAKITVTGSNYAANEKVSIYWDYTGPGSGKLLTTVSADSSGSFSTFFNLPLYPTGNYTVAGVGQSSGRVAKAVFDLLPRLALTPLAAGPDTSIQITGHAFGAGEAINLYWNYSGPGTGTLITTVNGNSTGTFHLTINVPSYATPGQTTIEAIGKTTNAMSFADFILYPPTVALAPLVGAAGTSLTVSVYGFEPNEGVTLHWNNTSIGTYSTSGFGYLAPTTFTVPAGTSPGNYTVQAVGSVTNRKITNTFKVVAASSSLGSVSGPVGATINVFGQGYTPGETVNLLWNYTGPGTGTSVGSTRSGFAGSISGSFTVPFASVGSYTVAAIGATSNDVTQNTFNVQVDLAASPAITPPGANVTVSGTGFQPGETVNLYLDSSSGVLLGTTTTGSSGNISQAIALPTNVTPGSHSLVGIGQSSSTQLKTDLTVDTSWGDFGFDPHHDRTNPSEFTLNSSNVANLSLKWSASTSINLQSSPVYANGLVYLATSDGKLEAFNATSGTLAWQFDSQTSFANFSSPLVDPATGIVTFGVVGHSFTGVPSPYYALDAHTGALLWSTILPWNDFGFPSLASGTIYVGTAKEAKNAAVFAIDEVSGHIDWQINNSSSAWGAFAIDAGANAVFTGEGNPANAVVAFNATTGAQLWQFSVPNSPGDLDVGAGVDVENGLVYAHSKNGSIYALHENDGTLAWSTSLDNGNIDVSAPAYAPYGAHGIIYSGASTGRLYALDASTGSVLWSYKTQAAIFSSPAVANGIVYFCDKSPTTAFYALDARSGALLWSTTIGNLSYSSPIIVNGWLYYGSTDGNLYAFSL